MTFDGELEVAIVDEAETFAREFRKQLWAEHLVRPAATLDDPNTAYATFKADVLASSGRVRPYTAAPAGSSPPIGHAQTIRWVVDPYGGPPR
jgi:hypothetical protein